MRNGNESFGISKKFNYEISEIDRLIKSLSQSVKEFMLKPENYKNYHVARNHAIQIEKIISRYRRPTPQPHCFYCKSLNHLMNDCEKLKREIFRKNFECRDCGGNISRRYPNPEQNTNSKRIPKKKNISFNH